MRLAPCPWNKKLFACSPSDCWSPSVSCVLGTITGWLYRLSSVSSFLTGSIATKMLFCFIFMLFWGTIEFPKFMLIFLVAVLISWFRWCRILFGLIIFRILFCSPLVMYSFLAKLLLLPPSLLFLYLFCLSPFFVFLYLFLLYWLAYFLV